MRVGKTKGGRQPKRPPEYDKICFPTPETCQNPDNPYRKEVSIT